jgi:hypothetical protein
MKKHGFDIKARVLPSLVAKIRKDFHLPISYQRGKGYFIATKQKDFDMAINDMKSQIQALQCHITFLESFNV